MRLRDNEDAVSELLGYVILLSIVVTALALVILLSGSSIMDTKKSAQFTGAEQAFTIADSRMSKARFSTSIFQEIPFKLTDGTLLVNGSHDDSYIEVIDVDGMTHTNTTLYRGALGTVKCVMSNGEIGYQDGGVWVKYHDEGSVMISPPDFDYNGVTLTLPVTHIDGNSSAAYSNSGVLLHANSTGQAQVIYPGANGQNPIPPNHTINIYIKSDYLEAWKNYINERTRANATIIPDQSHPGQKLVYVNLSSGTGRQSGLMNNGFTTKSMNTSDTIPVQVFHLTLYTDNTGVGNDFRLQYDSQPTNADPSLSIYAGRTTGEPNQDYVHVQFTYEENGYKEDFDGYIPFQRKSEHLISIDLLNPNLMLNYTSRSSGESKSWGTNNAAFDTGFVQGYYNSSDLGIGQTKSIFDVTEHYLKLMAQKYPLSGPVYEVHTNPPPHGYDEDISNYILQYNANQDIKYLYITEGTLNVTLGARS